MGIYGMFFKFNNFIVVTFSVFLLLFSCCENYLKQGFNLQALCYVLLNIGLYKTCNNNISK